MNDIIHVGENPEPSQQEIKHAFINDVKEGLSQVKKQIQSKYFYDELGSKLFNRITRHPDYYLTACEIEILNTYKQQIVSHINVPFNLIELGPGEGIKTQILMKAFLERAMLFNYIPIDISEKYLKTLAAHFTKVEPSISVIPIHSDYVYGLRWLNKKWHGCNLILFLGSSIGNLDPEATALFLQRLYHALHEGDYVLIGFDLRKDVATLIRAYNDDSGITKQFNLNLLTRMNRELGAHFDVAKFHHYATYNVYSGAMESYLMSLEKQIIAIDAIPSAYSFEAVEPIHVEYSYKYSIAQINGYAKNAGFQVIEHFSDTKNYFVDSLWRRGSA